MNPFAYRFSQGADGSTRLKKITLFPVLPFVTWNFKFK